LGCDLELVEARPENFFRDFFTTGENEFLARSSPHERPVLSTLIWSAKESVLKCLREGLRRDTRSVAVTVPPAPATRSWKPVSVSCVELACRFSGWWRLDGSHIQVVTASPNPAVPSPLILR
jgi:4'-phosphopantetheinyl transferase